ncbi:hypothetical protein E2C01_017489 [Portunus trituberculatus]|uniref:Uncharacterized protein n=1 Tax=Portunus trituberculatus TaxID=210409 RepID=A0A5B7DSM4_PORTR|nr:hypothetical protein [Portunus trituberculatus]
MKRLTGSVCPVPQGGMCGRRGPSREGGGRGSGGEEGPSHHLPYTCRLLSVFTRSLTCMFDIFSYSHK